MQQLEQLKVLKPFVIFVVVFILAGIIASFNTKEELLCGTVTKFKMLNTGGNIGSAPVGFVGYSLDVDLEENNTSIQFSTNIVNPRVGQLITIKRERSIFLRRPTYTVIDSTKCISSNP